MEKKVAETLLEEKKVIVIEGVTYEVNPPSIATLVLASKYIRDLPNEILDEERLVSDLFRLAHQLPAVGYALSAMILGVKEFEKEEVVAWYSFKKQKEKQGHILAKKINNAPIKQVFSNFYKILEAMNLSDFFQLTTFLIELNMTRPTREVEKKTTAFGQ